MVVTLNEFLSVIQMGFEPKIVDEQEIHELVK